MGSIFKTHFTRIRSMAIKIDLRNKKPSAKELALEPKERTKLNKTLLAKKDRIIFLLGCYAGLRAEEISQCRFDWLKWSIINDFKVLAIQIPKEDKSTRKEHYKDGSKKYAKFKQKKDWSKTAIYIFDNEVANEIYYYFDSNREGLQISRVVITQHYVSGRTRSGHWINGHFSKILGRKVTTHALRATYTNYITQEFRLPNGEKLDPMFVKTQLRHSDIKTTMKHYKSESKAHQEAYLMGVMQR